MDAFWQDLKYAARGLRRSPGFAAAAVFALALGIGSNTVIFSALQSVVLNPRSLRALKDPDRLVMLWEKNPSLTLFFANRVPPRLRSYRAWKEQARSFEDMAVWAVTSLTLTANEDRAGRQPEQLETGIASANFFPLLGIPLRMGRSFTAEEMQLGQGQVAIVSDELYRGRFAADPQILGKTLTASGKQYRIVGVLPPGFQLPALWEGFDRKSPKLWIPVDLHPPANADGGFTHFVYGRLRPGVSIEQARAEMSVIVKRLTAAFPDRYTGFGSNLFSLAQENLGPELRRALLVLQVAVVFVLLIACANVGNLLLTRAVARDKEIAVRSALGASRVRILRQTLTESMVLSLAGAAAGLLLSFWAIRLLSWTAPEDIQALHDVRIDGTVLAFTIAVSLAAGVLFGLAPGWHLWQKSVGDALSRGSRSVTGSSHRLRSALAVTEVALSLVLLIGAGLMIRSMWSLMNTDLGFRPDHLLVMRVTLPELPGTKPAQVASFNRRLLESVRLLSGVQGAALTEALPMKSINQSSFEIVGQPHPPEKPPVANWARLSDGYFETLGIRLVQGRTLTRQDANSPASNVAVVNQAFARANFPHGDPLGKAIVFANEAGQKTQYSIVGVVANERQMGPDNEQSPQFYLPGNRLRSMILVVRTVGDPLSMAAIVKQQVWNIDKDQPVSDVTTAEAALREWTSPRRFNMVTLLSFACIALVLAAIGLYSVVAYSVTLRTREIGVRMALGAEPGMVARLILRQGLAVTLIGIAVGLCGALALTRFMQSLIFGIGASDPLTFVGVSALLAAVALLASYIPAARAARVDPIEALRVE